MHFIELANQMKGGAFDMASNAHWVLLIIIGRSESNSIDTNSFKSFW